VGREAHHPLDSSLPAQPGNSPVGASHRRPFLDYRYKVHCAFIVGASDPMPAPEAIFVCGAPVDGERVYCAGHARLCFDGHANSRGTGRPRRTLEEIIAAAGVAA